MRVRHPTGLASPATRLQAPPRPPTRTPRAPLCGRNNTRSPASPVARATCSPTALRRDATAVQTSVRAPETIERKLPIADGSHPSRRIGARNFEQSTEFRIFHGIPGENLDPIEITHRSKLITVCIMIWGE